MVNIVQAVVGVALLAFGRKGLVLFLTAFGVMVGVLAVSTYLSGAAHGITIAAMIVGGILGLLVALFVKNLAMVLAGILGGGYAGYALAHQMQWMSGGFPWIPVIVCAVLGIILCHYILKWALIILSAVVGAYLLVGSFTLSSTAATVVFVVLAAAGIWFQAASDKPRSTRQ